jgi:hypothetical protein
MTETSVLTFCCSIPPAQEIKILINFNGEVNADSYS